MAVVASCLFCFIYSTVSIDQGHSLLYVGIGITLFWICQPGFLTLHILQCRLDAWEQRNPWSSNVQTLTGTIFSIFYFCLLAKLIWVTNTFQGERNFNRFGGWLGKYSTTNKNRRLLEDVHSHILASQQANLDRSLLYHILEIYLCLLWWLVLLLSHIWLIIVPVWYSEATCFLIWPCPESALIMYFFAENLSYLFWF